MMKNRKYIDDFNFNIRIFSEKDRILAQSFNTGKEYPEKGIGDYLKSDEIFKDMACSDAITYIVTCINKINDTEEIVAYFSITSSSLPYFYRDIDDSGNYVISDILCGISAIKINMFGVDCKFQNVFYKDSIEEKPVSAWIFEAIIGMIDEMATNTLGIKAIYLHTLPSAKDFYCKNYMKPAGSYFYPLSDNDDELEILYTLIREVKGLNGK